MPETDLTRDHADPITSVETRASRYGTWLDGYFSFWIAYLVILGISVIPMVILLALVIVMSNLASASTNGVALFFLFFVIPIVWLWLVIRFFFPSIISINRLARGYFFNFDRVSLSDALAIIPRQLLVLKADVLAVRRWFRA